MRKHWYDRLFGSGPLGAAASLALLGVAWGAEQAGLGGTVFSERDWLAALLAIAAVVAAAIIIASLRSLPVDKRGMELVTAGPFRHVRHPLYAAFLSVFVPAFALFLNDWTYVIWAAALHPLWHRLIGREERICLAYFGPAYATYARQTGRFLPRLFPVRLEIRENPSK